MQKQFLCLANAAFQNGRILVVTPLDAATSNSQELQLPPINILIAANSKANIPTGFVADVLPLDILQVKVTELNKSGSILKIDPWSLQIPSRMCTDQFQRFFATKLKDLVEKFATTSPKQGNSIQLLQANGCQFQKAQKKKRIQMPILEFDIHGDRFSAPTADAQLIESYQAGLASSDAPKSVFVILQEGQGSNHSQKTVLGVIQSPGIKKA